MVTLSSEHEWDMLFPLSSSFKPARMLCFACHPPWQHKQEMFIFVKEHYFALHVSTIWILIWTIFSRKWKEVIYVPVAYKQSEVIDEWIWWHDSCISNNWQTIWVTHSALIHSVPLHYNGTFYFWIMIGVHIY